MWLKNIFQKIFKKKKKEIDFNSIVFPMIRRIAPSLISNDLISISPMSAGIYEPENVYSRDIIIEKTGFKTKTEKKYARYPSVQIFYVDYKFTPMVPVQHITLDIKLDNERVL